MLNTYGYCSDSGFVGIPKQIIDAVDTQTNVLGKNIKEQTETIETQTNIQHQDSEALKEEQIETRNTLTNLFGALAKTFKNIFTTDKGDVSGETFYEMVQRENNETQQYMAAHTETMANSLEINANVLKEAIDANTSGDTVNFTNLIETLRQNGENLDKALSEDIVDAIRNEIINSGSF